MHLADAFIQSDLDKVIHHKANNQCGTFFYYYYYIILKYMLFFPD